MAAAPTASMPKTEVLSSDENALMVQEVRSWATDVKFAGFDGNEERAQMQIARFLVADLHAASSSPVAEEALRRIAQLYAIEQLASGMMRCSALLYVDSSHGVARNARVVADHSTQRRRWQRYLVRLIAVR